MTQKNKYKVYAVQLTRMTEETVTIHVAATSTELITSLCDANDYSLYDIADSDSWDPEQEDSYIYLSNDGVPVSANQPYVVQGWLDVNGWEGEKAKDFNKKGKFTGPLPGQMGLPGTAVPDVPGKNG